jgi:hypothetical protein
MIRSIFEQICQRQLVARILAFASLSVFMCCNSARAQWTIGGNPTNNPGCNAEGDQYGILSNCTLNGKAYKPVYEWKQGWVWSAGVGRPTPHFQWSGDINTVLKWVGTGSPAKSATVLVWVGGSVQGLAQGKKLDLSIDDGVGDTPTLAFDTSDNIWSSSERAGSYHVVTYDTSGGNPTFITKPTHFIMNGDVQQTDDLIGTGGDIDAFFQVIQPCSVSATSTGYITAGPDAQSDITVGPDAQFVSGTDCTVYGELPVFPPNASVYITSAQLLLNGTVVKSYSNTSGKPDPNVPSGLNVIFDSTHFCSSSILNATIMATDSQGTHYGGVLGEPTDGSQAFTVMVNNSAVVLANRTADLFGSNNYIMSQVQSNLSSTNHSPIIKSDSYKAKPIYDLIPQQTVFFTHTHAGIGVFNDCLAGQDGWDPGHIDGGGVFQDDIATRVALKGSMDPPYNFVHINGCHSAGTESLSDTSLATAFGIGAPDTAYVGWLDEIELMLCGPWINGLYSDLAAGDTLEDAIINSDNLGPPGPANYLDPVVGYYGDGQMQLTGVYLGSGGWQWYR